jgi:hypothetical protein
MKQIDEIRKEATALKPSVNHIEQLIELVKDCISSLKPFSVNLPVIDVLKNEQLPAAEGLRSGYSEDAFESIRHYILNRLLEVKPA